MNVTTSATLIKRIHLLDDKAAWDRFYNLYAPLVKSYALRRGCTQAMSDDILQLTFVSLMKVLPKFEFEPEKGRFRAYLYRVVKCRIADTFEEQRKLSESGSITQYDRMINEFEDVNVEAPGKAWDDLWDKNLLNQAFDQVKKNICEKGDEMTLDIFEFYVFWFLYYTLELHIVACASALMGTVLQIVGMVKLYLGARSANGAKW